MLCAGLLLPARAGAQGEPTVPAPARNYPAEVFDVVIVRPIGLAAAAVGAALFVPTAIVTAPSGLDSIQQALDHFVIVPGKFVFQRPLGEF